MDAVETPLFPLNTVLFPGGSVLLRIFETRYLDMVGRCLKSGTEFGVVAIRRGHEVGEADFYPFGTSARITDWFGEARGILGIRATGTHRFSATVIRRQRDGLYLGLARRLLESLERNAGGRELNEKTLGDMNRVSWRLAELLPLPVAQKQMLLETDDVQERMSRLAAAATEARSER